MAAAARWFAAPNEELESVIPAEPGRGARVYLCSFAGRAGRTWIALDATGAPVDERSLVRDAVSIAALCEIAEESAGGGDLERLRAHLAELELAEAERAAVELEGVIGAPPRVASPQHLDHVGGAARRLELALSAAPESPFAEAMKHAVGTVEELKLEVEGAYKVPLR